MPNAGSALHDVELQSGTKWEPLPRADDDGDCVVLPKQSPSATVRYRVQLNELTGRWGDPDFASRLGPAWVFHDQAVLVMPEEALFETAMTVKFVLPTKHRVSTPWAQNDDGTFSFTAAQHDGGAYIVLGKLRLLEDVVTPRGTARLTLVDEPKEPTDDQLRAWVRGVLETLGDFYKAWPSSGARPLHVVLAGVNDDSAGVFGSVRRRRDASVMLLFGAHAKSGWDRDWVALHELFHLGNPPTSQRFAWFSEGFTTYFTELLRGRRGAKSEAEVWGSLASALREHCQPIDGSSLTQTSRGMAKNAQWMKVYWGGACLALRVDVVMRLYGHSTLDALMRTLRASTSELSEKDVVDALDKAAGSHLASRHLAETKRIPIEELLTTMGVGPVVDDKAALNDKAPFGRLTQGADKLESMTPEEPVEAPAEGAVGFAHSENCPTAEDLTEGG